MEVDAIRTHNLKVGIVNRKRKIATLKKEIEQGEQVNKIFANIDKRYCQVMAKIGSVHMNPPSRQEGKLSCGLNKTGLNKPSRHESKLSSGLKGNSSKPL